MKRGIAFVGSSLATAVLSLALASRAEEVRMSPAACEKIDRLKARVNGRDVTQGTPTFEASDTGSGTPSVMLAKNDSSSNAAFTCPVPDSESHPAWELHGVNVHATDRSSSGSVVSFLYSRLWFAPGFRSTALARTSPSGTCTTDPDCTLEGSLEIPDDGNFRSLVVVLPGKPNGGKASELNGLFFY